MSVATNDASSYASLGNIDFVVIGKIGVQFCRFIIFIFAEFIIAATMSTINIATYNATVDIYRIVYGL